MDSIQNQMPNTTTPDKQRSTEMGIEREMARYRMRYGVLLATRCTYGAGLRWEEDWHFEADTSHHFIEHFPGLSMYIKVVFFLLSC